MPILRVASALDESASARATRTGFSSIYTSVRALADSPADSGLLGEQSSQKWEDSLPWTNGRR